MAKAFKISNDPDGKTLYEPETLTEEIAWAICRHDIESDEGRLTNDELEGFKLVIGVIEKFVQPYNAEQLAVVLDCPVAAVERYYFPLREFLETEKAIREKDDGNRALLIAHAIANDWQNYMPAAKAAYEIVTKDPKAAIRELKRIK